MNQENGLTIITLTYDRKKGLTALIDGLLAQNLNDLKVEYILCNNFNKKIIGASLFTKIGRRIRKFSDIKIINSSYNYRCQIRYQLATMAKYKTVLFLDDDIVLLDKNFVFKMWKTFQTLPTKSILSCWCTLWAKYQENSFLKIDVNFRQQIINDLMICDTAGPGISMFSKSIVMHPRILDMTPEFKKSDDMGFSLVANLIHGTQVYYYPSFGQIKFHDQEKIKHAISQEKTYFGFVYTVWKSLWQEGYKPAMDRLKLTDKKLQILAQEKLISKENQW